MNKQKQIKMLHEYLKKENIIDESISLHFWMNIGSSFAPEGMGKRENAMIIIDEQDGQKEDLIKVYLHEVGHAIHFFEDNEDWEEKEQLYDVYYKYGEEIFGYTKEFVAYYEKMPLEKEANELAKVLWIQVLEDWDKIF